MKKEKIIFSLCLCLFLILLVVGFSEAGTATIRGYVTEEDGITPAVGIPVTIKVTSIEDKRWLPNTAPWESDDFPWMSKTVNSDADGLYQATISFPDVIEIKFKAKAIKSDAAVFKTGENFLDFENSPPANNASYELDITLSPPTTNYSIIVKGYLKDSETGEFLSNYDIGFRIPGQNDRSAETDSTGYYQELIYLLESDDLVTVGVPSGYDPVEYITQTKAISVSSGNIYDLDFELMRKKSAPYVYGTVTEAATGQPIPFATILIEHSPSGWPLGRVPTDFLGRYKQFLPAGSGGSYFASTTGAHTIDVNKSTYVFQSKLINGSIVNGKAYRVDFNMIRKPAPKGDRYIINEE